VLERKPMPETARGLDGVRAPMIGRDAEIQQVYGQVAGLRAVAGALIAIVGEAGLGKSRLVAEVRQLIEADAQSSINWLEGRAISYGHAIAYYPWRQVIRQAIGAQEGDRE
jgi:predicted ATPase